MNQTLVLDWQKAAEASVKINHWMSTIMLVYLFILISYFVDQNDPLFKFCRSKNWFLSKDEIGLLVLIGWSQSCSMVLNDPFSGFDPVRSGHFDLLGSADKGRDWPWNAPDQTATCSVTHLVFKTIREVPDERPAQNSVSHTAVEKVQCTDGTSCPARLCVNVLCGPSGTARRLTWTDWRRWPRRSKLRERTSWKTRSWFMEPSTPGGTLPAAWGGSSGPNCR